jgi:small subunit ribosomal protein S4
MGDPRKTRAKSKGPTHPWNKQRIDEEKILVRDYGLKNKTEIWKAQSELKRITTQAKKLIRDKKLDQSKLETTQLLNRLQRLGLIAKGTPVEDVLALTVKDILDRRLQSVVYRAGLSGTTKQSRQMIVHGHVFVNGKKIDVPSYLVGVEDTLEYNPKSGFNDEANAEIVKMTKKVRGESAPEQTKEEKPAEESKVEEKPAEKKAEEEKK